jgi:hypothetical protein
MSETVFDARYYRRFYESSRTAVVTTNQAKAEVGFVLAFCNHVGLRIRRFTDAGAGTGWWAKEFRRQYKSQCVIETFDSSEAAAKGYGHTQVGIEDIPLKPADLVVCRDVLRYLNDAAAKRAIRRLARKTRGVLYLHVITSDDEVDEEASDMSGYFRTASWYRRELKKAGFVNVGMGLFASSKFKTFDPFALEVPK